MVKVSMKRIVSTTATATTIEKKMKEKREKTGSTVFDDGAALRISSHP